ncbi:hypothetical protein SLA2020_278220 [Shorea laevis]
MPHQKSPTLVSQDVVPPSATIPFSHHRQPHHSSTHRLSKSSAMCGHFDAKLPGTACTAKASYPHTEGSSVNTNPAIPPERTAMCGARLSQTTSQTSRSASFVAKIHRDALRSSSQEVSVKSPNMKHNLSYCGILFNFF